MSIQLVPVIEIRHGKCVHTEAKNKFVDQVVKEDVLDVVDGWVDKGVTRIHLVDVDAVESGEPENVDLISRIKAKHNQLKVQVIGGIKCIESAYIWIDGGADFLVLNGKALRQRNLLDDICVEFPGRVLMELDCREGLVGMGSGEPDFKLSHLAQQLAEDGVAGLVVTDISADGKNLTSLNQLSETAGIPIFANGGVEKVADLKDLLESSTSIPSGILLGKVLHHGFCLNEANKLIKEHFN